VIFFFRHHQAQLMEDRGYQAEFSTGFPASIAIVVVKRTSILFWRNSAQVDGPGFEFVAEPRLVISCAEMRVNFFFRHHQAQLTEDREYEAEFSPSFPVSIAIVVVKRTSILA
jgi:hypothetical protein